MGWHLQKMGFLVSDMGWSRSKFLDKRCIWDRTTLLPFFDVIFWDGFYRLDGKKAQKWDRVALSAFLGRLDGWCRWL